MFASQKIERSRQQEEPVLSLVVLSPMQAVLSRRASPRVLHGLLSRSS